MRDARSDGGCEVGRERCRPSGVRLDGMKLAARARVSGRRGRSEVIARRFAGGVGCLGLLVVGEALVEDPVSSRASSTVDVTIVPTSGFSTAFPRGVQRTGQHVGDPERDRAI